MSLAVMVPGTASADEYSDSEAALALTNEVRAWNGVAPLGWDGYLQWVADSWAVELASRGYVTHNPDLSWLLGDYWYWGENVGLGPSVEAIHRGLVGSRSHYRNIVASRFTNVAVGIAYGWDGTVFLVEVFGG